MLAFWVAVKAAYTWCKGHLVTVGFALIGVLGFLFGFMAKKRPVIVQGVDPVKTKAEQQTAVEDAQAQAQEEKVIQDAESTEVTDQDAVVTQETTETTKVEGNVDQTNQYLKDVSSDIAGTASIPITAPSSPPATTKGGSK
jgi:hypothetical protein